MSPSPCQSMAATGADCADPAAVCTTIEDVLSREPDSNCWRMTLVHVEAGPRVIPTAGAHLRWAIMSSPPEPGQHPK